MSIDYLTDAEALHLNEVQGFVIRDVGLLLSAVARPQTTVYGVEAYPDLWTKAPALMESLARNHALVDGKADLTRPHRRLSRPQRLGPATLVGTRRVRAEGVHRPDGAR